MKKNILLLALLIIPFIQNYALPRFALRLKDNCSSCHFNPTGGGMRNEDGVMFGKNILSMISPRDQDFQISPKISNNISFGFDYRTQFLYSSEKGKSDFQDMTGSAYLNVDISEKINVVAKYDFVQSIWEAFGVAKILPNNGYVKIGSFVPNFGIHLDDHTAYTRGGDYGLLFSKGSIQGLIYNPFYLETGAEIGFNFTDYFNLTTSVGKSKSNPIFSTDPTWTARLELTPSVNKFHFILGGSYASLKSKFSNPDTGEISQVPSAMYGAFAGIGYNDFTLMAEYDIATNFVANNIKSDALMIEAAYQLFVGMDAIVRYDRFKSNIDAVDEYFSHLILGVEFFPYSFVELRPQLRFGTHAPNHNNSSFVLQFHFWY